MTEEYSRFEARVKHEITERNHSENRAIGLGILALFMAGGVLEQRVRESVQARRERLGWTQRELAKRLKAALPQGRQRWAKQSNISKYESGAVGADIDLHVAIVGTVGLSFTRLIGALPTPADVHEPVLDPLARAVAEAVATGRLDLQHALSAVNLIRQMAGLPEVGQTGAPTRAKRG